MTDLRKLLIRKEEELSVLIESLEESLTGAPEGGLRIMHGSNVPQYFYRSEETDGPYKTGQYIKKENMQLAYLLAQRDYERKLLKIAEMQLKSIRKFLKEYHEEDLENVYMNLNEFRKKIVIPEIQSDEQYAKQWEQMEFVGKPILNDNIEIYSDKGERVRSKSEKIIADMLYRNGVPYRYECPININGIGTIYPDFTILNVRKRKELYWEHFGMMDVPEYCELYFTD